MEKALKFLLYSLGLAILLLSLSIDKDKTLEIILGISIVAGFLFALLIVLKIRKEKNEDSNDDK